MMCDEGMLRESVTLMHFVSNYSRLLIVKEKILLLKKGNRFGLNKYPVSLTGSKVYVIVCFCLLFSKDANTVVQLFNCDNIILPQTLPIIETYKYNFFVCNRKFQFQRLSTNAGQG